MSELSAAIFASDDAGLTAVATPEWPAADGKLFVRRLTAREKLELAERRKAANAPDGDGFVAFTVACCTVDQQGQRVFTDADWERLRERASSPVERLFVAADQLNILSAAAAGELEKN